MAPPPLAVGPVLLGAAAVAAGAAALCWAGALGNLSALGAGSPLRVCCLGAAAGRPYFSARGWRYRRAARGCETLTVVALAGWAAASPTRVVWALHRSPRCAPTGVEHLGGPAVCTARE